MKLLSLALIALLLSACAQHVNRPEQDVPLPETRYRVATIEDFTAAGTPYQLDAKLYTPISLGPFPTVIVVGGRGWRGASPHEGEFIAQYFAGRGFAVMNIAHRSLRDAAFPAQLDDLRDAVRWLDTHASEHGLDMGRLVLLGFESGAHLVSLLALSQNGRGDGLLGRHDPSLPPVRAVIAGGTPSDLTTLGDKESVALLLEQVGRQGVSAAEVSPLYRVHAGAPPFFLFHGTTDGRVPIEQSEAMLQALDTHGVSVELYRMRLRGHTTGYLTMPGALRAASEFLWREVVQPDRYARKSP